MKKNALKEFRKSDAKGLGDHSLVDLALSPAAAARRQPGIRRLESGVLFSCPPAVRSCARNRYKGQKTRHKGLSAQRPKVVRDGPQIRILAGAAPALVAVRRSAAITPGQPRLAPSSIQGDQVSLGQRHCRVRGQRSRAFGRSAFPLRLNHRSAAISVSDVIEEITAIGSDAVSCGLRALFDSAIQFPNVYSARCMTRSRKEAKMRKRGRGSISVTSRGA